jgi:hypothetical protein
LQIAALAGNPTTAPTTTTGPKTQHFTAIVVVDHSTTTTFRGQNHSRRFSMSDVPEVVMRGALNKLRVRSEAGVPSLDRTAKSAEVNHEPSFCDDTVGGLVNRWERARKPESRRLVAEAALDELANGRRSPRRVDPATIEGKYAIAVEANLHGVRETARRYDVPKSNVHRWAKQQRELQGKLRRK